ncbi:hypothetical protein [Cryobacterium sp. MDB2-33-2]|uniref:hypothetical protein n=1 Tax=Cryobacterium sp. MDB2-33-2 TaxID=1259179 RepID=UPI00106D15C2|nr:hypothetical protein [Cryobacterium sp. MDB2-33-2]TFC03379.1 hypothetical protein E3O59_16000 [Cryobacterium sp. MDB2-33-2]
MFDERVTTPASRWLSVTFLQGKEATEVLGIIDRSGVTTAVEYLQQWDHGDETTDAALTNGYVYDRIPAGSTDRTVEDDGSPYALTYSTRFRYVSLLRRHPLESELESVPAAPGGPARQTARARAGVADPWVDRPDRSANLAGQAVSL